ncbi:MAG TPA: membrane protein insertase YidC [Terracidiphilus sp.]|nr:membrane protein insertase YidC [Terracidiphilus sp.]
MPEIRNPNLEPGGSGGGPGSGGDFRSLITFMFLALAVLLGYQYFRPKPAEPAPQQQAQQQAESQPQTQPQASTQAQSTSAGAPASAAATRAATRASQQTPAIVASSESETTVENELYKIVFTNRGAQVKHWILKKYFDTTGKPLDMAQPQLTAKFGMPLSLFTYDPGLSSQINGALYQVSVSGTQTSATGQLLAPCTLTFHYAENGLDVVKTFHFDSSYVIGIDTSVRRNGEPVRALVDWPSGLGDMEQFLPPSQSRNPLPTPSQIVWSIDDKQDTTASAKVSGNATYDQPYEYAAVTDLYFAAAFLPDSPQSATLVTQHHTVEVPSDLSNPNSEKKPSDVLGLAMGSTTGDTRLRLYAGPKATEILSSIHAIGADGKPNGPSLAPLIQYGMWTIIAKPLYYALRWLRNMLGPGAYNWGWAIIIITVIFNLVLLPTRFMMMKSSLKMMRIQPKVEVLKRKYAHLKATDPKRSEMNAEMMQLYKDEGVNMYGGCLPMLLQMPLFFAYYKVLLNAVELRQAHWFWLTDLSAPDPLHILPALIIVTMFLVQYITPSPGMDPTQRRMMAIVMPVFMGFILWHYASGLALYWITGNFINLAIQIGINKSSMGKEMHAIAARRAQKKSSSGAGQRVIQGRR